VVAPFAASAVRTGRRKVLLTAWPVLGAIFYSFATTAKSGLLIAVVLAIASGGTAYAIRSGGRGHLSFKKLLFFGAAATVILYICYFIISLRIAKNASTQSAVLTRKFMIYATGSIPALGQWLGSKTSPTSPQLGTQTWGGVVKVLTSNRGSAAYTDFSTIDKSSTAVTNVYTFMRPLIEDYTLGGAFLFLILFACGSAYAYRRAVISHTPGAIICTCAAIAYLVFGFIDSIFAYTNIILAFVIAYLLLRRLISIAPKHDLPGNHHRDTHRTVHNIEKPQAPVMGLRTDANKLPARYTTLTASLETRQRAEAQSESSTYQDCAHATWRITEA
jgi:oligosaccharide repeat unit polymerase